MIVTLAKKVFGTRNERLIKHMVQDVARINELEPVLTTLSDSELRAKTDELKTRLAQGEELDALLHEAFAVVREAARRTLDMRHFDVQLIGGMVLHQGKIAEMRTGEGKTLVATLTAYLNALTGKGVHIVTVNDYLARRDAEWMGKWFPISLLRRSVRPTWLISPTVPTTNLASITCATTWRFVPTSAFSAS